MVYALREGLVDANAIKNGESLAVHLMMVINDDAVKSRLSLATKLKTNYGKDISDEDILYKSGLKQLKEDGSVVLSYNKPEKQEYEDKAKKEAARYGYKWATNNEFKNAEPIKTIPKDEAKLDPAVIRTAQRIAEIKYVSKKDAKAQDKVEQKQLKKEAKEKGQKYKRVNKESDIIVSRRERRHTTTDRPEKNFQVNRKVGEFEVKRIMDENDMLKKQQIEMHNQILAMQKQQEATNRQIELLLNQQSQQNTITSPRSPRPGRSINASYTSSIVSNQYNIIQKRGYESDSSSRSL